MLYEVITVSVWAKQKSGKGATFQLSIPACKQEYQFELTPEWAQYSFLFKSDTTSTNAILNLDLIGQGVAWFDEVNVSQEPNLSYSIQPDNSALVAIKTNIQDVNLYYSLSGSKRANKYKAPFAVTNPTVVKAMVKKNNETLAVGQIFVPINKALNKPVAEGTQPHEQYTAQGLSSLTDGKLGTTSFKNPNWMGYLDSVVMFVITSYSIHYTKLYEILCVERPVSG